jgi:general secretion pathway protein J
MICAQAKASGMKRPLCGNTQKGFTLIELVIALTLLALISTVLFGVFRIAGDFVEKGTVRTEDAASIRLVEDFLRAQWENAHPLRQRKNLENPLIFEGKDNQVIYISALPPRVLGGGLWAWRLRVVREEHGKLILERAVPDTSKENLPTFSADLKMRSVLADRVKSVAFEYYGITGEAVNAEPKWSKSWDDPQRMPQMIRKASPHSSEV